MKIVSQKLIWAKELNITVIEDVYLPKNFIIFCKLTSQPQRRGLPNISLVHIVPHIVDRGLQVADIDVVNSAGLVLNVLPDREIYDLGYYLFLRLSSFKLQSVGLCKLALVGLKVYHPAAL